MRSENAELETIPETLRFDIAAIAVTNDHLNNFFCNMPGGFYRSTLILELAFKQGETFLNAIERIELASGKKIESLELLGYSQNKLQKLPNEFFQDIDDAISQSQLSAENIREEVANISRDRHGSDERTKAIEQLHKKLLPVYLRLRAKGYSHRDLVG